MCVEGGPCVDVLQGWGSALEERRIIRTQVSPKLARVIQQAPQPDIFSLVSLLPNC